MDEMETKLDIVIRSVVDEASAEKAPQEITKIILGALKDGYIKIPAAISDEFDKSKVSRKLIKAQEDFVKQWTKLSEEGFSSSEEDLDSFIKKYNKFSKLLDKEAKDSKQRAALDSLGLNNIAKNYKNAQKQIKLKATPPVESVKTKPAPKRPRNFGKHSKEEIDANIKNEQYRGWEKTGPKGLKTNTRPTAIATPHTANLTEWGSSYEVPANRQIKESQKIARQTYERTSFRKYTVSDSKLDELIKIAKSISNKKDLSEQQKNTEKAGLSAQKAKETIGKIERGKDVEKSKEDFEMFTKGVGNYIADAGKSEWDTMNLITNTVMSRYHNVVGTLGLGYDKEKGVGPNHEEATKVLGELMDTFTDTMKDELVALDSYEAQQRKILARMKDWAGLKALDEGTSLTKTKKSGDKDNSLLVRELKASQALQNNTTKAISDTTKTIENQTAYDKVENTAERVADREAGKKSQELVSISKEDLTSGFNTDVNSERLIQLTKNISDSLKSIVAGKVIKNQEKHEIEGLSRSINLPFKTTDMYEKLQSATRLGLPKPDGRRKRISNGLIPEPSKSTKEFALIKQDITKALTKLPIDTTRVLKEAMHPSVLDTREKINMPDQVDKYEYDETMLRRLADLSNQRKAARKNIIPPPKVIIPGEIRGKLSRSEITSSIKDPSKWFIRLKDSIADLLGVTANYKKVMAATSEEQDKLAAKRIKTYGMERGRNVTGDKILFARSRSLWRNLDEFKKVFGQLKLSEGIKIDTTKVTDKLGKVLAGKQMRNAQMGGSPLRNLIGYGTGFIGMPSLEKSRAAADALNQINANIREAMNQVLKDIEDKESALAGMEASGDLILDQEGNVLEGSSVEAKTLVAELESTKLILDSILADMGTVDDTVKKAHGNIGKIMKRLSFTSSALRKNNAIVNNINAGYDKGGKALRFQTRTAEILNYAFQLMGRHLGQWVKRLALAVSPMNLIKKAVDKIRQGFNSFAGYDVKWQRTLNVIKYNMRTVLRPAMEWLAQKLVNIIGFFDIISMKIQEAFGRMPISVFDQIAADSEKTREELEQAANVTAGFDELHDIGSDNTGANDVLGDIYKPQLSEKWKELAERIGDLFAGLIKGDLGFGEVAKEILGILGQLLANIASTIWEWFKNTAIGKYLIENWKSILAKILAAFVAWKLLKIAGTALFNALFGKLTGGAIGGVFSKIGGWITKALGATAFGKGIIEGITSLFTGGGGLLSTLKSVFVGHEAITAFGAWGETLGAIFAQSLLAIVGVALAGFSLAKGADTMQKNTSYNVALEQYGGKDEDKKSNVGAGVLSTLGSTAGGALAGLAIGGPIGAAIGAGVGLIAGLINTALAPALEKAAIKARDMNNEMQKIEYYEGAVKGAQTQVGIFDEQLRLLKEALDLDTESVYKQGEQLGISKARMEELVAATQNGTFTTEMLTGKEVELSGSLTNLAEKQEHATEVSEKLENAQKKLLKAQTELSIAQDIEAGNFEIAAARIEVAEAQGVYSTEQATAKRIQLYKQGGEEERKNLLQNLTQDQRQKMAEYNSVTDKELQELSKIWQESSEDVKKSLLDGVGAETQQKFQEEMNNIDTIIKQHQGFWQGVGDTIAEIFTFGNAKTWTYNGESKYEEEAKKGKFTVRTYAVGTNYVPNDGLAYLHQGEAVIPKKYNQPYQQANTSKLENAIEKLNQQVSQINQAVDRGINVKGQFVQRGTDLVASVERTNDKISNTILSNKIYAR